jgi:hypothetical protein
MTDRTAVSAVRIPVYGPAPCNTLIAWSTPQSGPLTPTVDPSVMPTDLRIHGWDPDNPDAQRATTQLSVSGFLSDLAVGNDGPFSAALNSLAGYIDDDGYVTVRVDYSLAVESNPGHDPFGARDAFVVFGWVLCTEPRATHPSSNLRVQDSLRRESELARRLTSRL